MARGDETTAAEIAPCKAATPTKNPWTKRLPQGWWLKRHEETLAAPGREESQIAFIGDSITDGWDQKGSGLEVWEKEFVPMKALNLGINCDSTQHVLWRLDHGAIDGLPNLKVAVVMIGVNNKGITRDKPADIAAGIEAVCKRIKSKAPQAKILLLGVFPRFFGKDNNEDVNETIAKLDDGERIFYLNINQKLLDTEGAIRDRVGHLSAKGYEVWAEAIGSSIDKLMATTPEAKGAKDAKGAKNADRRPPGGDGSMFYRVFVSRNDRNADGVVEKDEFRGSGDRFDQMDKNDNGKLDRAEIAELHRSRMADPLSMRQRIERGETRRPPIDLRPVPADGGDGGDPSPGENGDEPTALTPLGTRITAKQAFARLDVDANGKVTVAEFRRSPGMADLKKSQEVVAKVDQDGDGELSFGEFNRVFATRHRAAAPDPPS